MEDAVIVSAVRTAVGKAPKGTLSVMRPDELAASAIRAALAKVPGLDPASIEDVILGCAMPEAEQGLNVARIASLRAGIPVEASAVTVNRFCSSGLQAIAYGAERIMLGKSQAAVTGGTESMSMVPMGGNKVSPNPAPGRQLPGRLSQHRARRRKPRARVVYFAGSAGSVRASAAISAPSPPSRPDASRKKSCRSRCASTQPNGGKPSIREFTFDTDEGPRRDTSVEALGETAGRPSTCRAPSRPATRRKRATAPRR